MMENGYLQQKMTELKKQEGAAKGFKQKEGMDYYNTYSPTVQVDSLRITIVIADRYKLFEYKFKGFIINLFKSSTY